MYEWIPAMMELMHKKQLMMNKCAMCDDMATDQVSWFASKPQSHKVCNACAARIWNVLSCQYSGTEAYNTFTIEPCHD